MANYGNVEDFFNTENLVDSQGNTIIPIRTVTLEPDSEHNPGGERMRKWKPDSTGLKPTPIQSIRATEEWTGNITLENGNYARVEIHPIVATELGVPELQNGGTISVTLYNAEGEIISQTNDQPFPGGINGNQMGPVERSFLSRDDVKLGVFIANTHRAGKYNVEGVLTETTFDYEYGIMLMPYTGSFGYDYPTEDTYYPIAGSFRTDEQFQIPWTLCNIGSVNTEADFITPNGGNSNKWMEFIADATTPKDSAPEEDEGRSAQEGESDGGNTNWPGEDGPSDNILPSEPPTEQVANVGLYGVWHLYQGDVRVLSNFLWSDDFFENVIKNMASPLENIISFGMVPFSHFAQTSQAFQICNVQVKSHGADYAALRITQNFYKLDCGAVSISDPALGALYNNFADYEPYTKYWLYLPFIGTVDLPADDIARDGKVKVQYKFDIITGACVAEVVTYTRASGWNITGRYSGNILTTFPLTGANYMQMYQQLAGSALGFAAGIATENVAAVAGSMMSAVTAKPQYSRGGSVSNVAGLLCSTRKPVIIKAKANAFEANTFKRDHGYKSNLTVTIGSAGGYISGSANQLKLKSIGRATQEELDEIQSLIGQGIYV